MALSKHMISWLGSVPEDKDQWLVLFHQGERRTMEACYREHFSTVAQAVGQLMSGADQETVIHEVFFRLLSQQKLREGFQGGSLGAWLSVMAKHRAIDYLRAHRREVLVDPGTVSQLEGAKMDLVEQKNEARILVERFRHEALPAKWTSVFEARFLDQLSQREAAVRLGMRRTTLAYQESRIRLLLRRYFLRQRKP
jgi:RNA polymerase sigma-70 factor (ECF subfamily)